MIAFQRAVLNTLAYADIFDYPLTFKEIHRWLIFNSSSARGSFKRKLLLKIKPIEKHGRYYCLPGRQKIISLRHKRARFSQLKFKLARRTAKLLALIPTIRMVAVTGALAMNNADPSDDIDLIIIASSNRLWLTRLFCVFLLELFRLRRRPGGKVNNFKNKICLNLFLDESALALPQSRRNLYTAHEICQTKPLWDRGETYQRFLIANQWVKNYLPNAIATKNLTLKTKKHHQSILANFFEQLAFKLQYGYMKKKITNEKIAKNFAFFHPRPTSKIVLKKYHQRLQQFHMQKKKVLVTGCFDILHQEHLNFLTKAKAVGDTLLVGVESDARVEKLKGSGRPVNSLKARLKNLKKWGIADKVFALPEKFNTPQDHLRLLKRLKPDILAVSSHTPNLAQKRLLMKKIGGIVKIVLPQNPKISTTKILQA
jgi:cytidyltransferase-like protein